MTAYGKRRGQVPYYQFNERDLGQDVALTEHQFGVHVGDSNNRGMCCQVLQHLLKQSLNSACTGWFRHSSRTPSPTMPVAPVMIALIFMKCLLEALALFV